MISCARNQRALSHAAQAETFQTTEDFLHLADFLADLSNHLFAPALGFQLWIVRRSPKLLFNFTYHLVKLSFGFVLSAFFLDRLLQLDRPASLR
jgi:hypothetical protein